MAATLLLDKKAIHGASCSLGSRPGRVKSLCLVLPITFLIRVLVAASFLALRLVVHDTEMIDVGLAKSVLNRNGALQEELRPRRNFSNGLAKLVDGSVSRFTHTQFLGTLAQSGASTNDTGRQQSETPTPARVGGCGPLIRTRVSPTGSRAIALFIPVVVEIEIVLARDKNGRVLLALVEAKC